MILFSFNTTSWCSTCIFLIHSIRSADHFNYVAHYIMGNYICVKEWVFDLSTTQCCSCCFHSRIAERSALLGTSWLCSSLRFVIGDVLCPLSSQPLIASPSYVNPSEAMCGSRMISWNNAIMQCYISRNRKYSTNAGGCDYDADHLLERK